MNLPLQHIRAIYCALDRLGNELYRVMIHPQAHTLHQLFAFARELTDNNGNFNSTNLYAMEKAAAFYADSVYPLLTESLTLTWQRYGYTVGHLTNPRSITFVQQVMAVVEALPDSPVRQAALTLFKMSFQPDFAHDYCNEISYAFDTIWAACATNPLEHSPDLFNQLYGITDEAGVHSETPSGDLPPIPALICQPLFSCVHTSYQYMRVKPSGLVYMCTTHENEKPSNVCPLFNLGYKVTNWENFVVKRVG